MKLYPIKCHRWAIAGRSPGVGGTPDHTLYYRHGCRPSTNEDSPQLFRTRKLARAECDRTNSLGWDAMGWKFYPVKVTVRIEP